MKKNILITAFAILFGACVFAQTNDNQLEMTPSKIKEIDSDKATVEFKTDVLNVEVYLNGSFYGRTNLEVTDLLPGVYTVDLKLAGYESQQFMIQAKKGFAQTYSLEMKLIQGSLTLLGLPEGAQIQLDGEIFNSSYKKTDTNVIYTVPGNHTVLVKCFGCTDFEQEVKVEGYKDSPVQLEMPVAAFELKDFTAVKATFNPDYKGRLGSCVFNFTVTNNQPVLAEIYDLENQLLWSKELGDFETWEQSFSWNGRAATGKALENGDYLAKVSSGTYKLETTVTISRSIDYPLFNANVTGSGVGPMPAVFGSQFDYFAVYLNTSPTVAVNLSEPKEERKNYFYGLGLSAGAVWDFAEHYELSGQVYTLPGHQNGFVGRVNGSFKAYIPFELQEDLVFTVGALVRLGFSTNGVYEPYGIDNGSGLIGPCALVGLSGKNWDAGFSSQFIVNSIKGSFKEKNDVWKNSFTGTFKPVKALSLNGWIGLNSAINVSSFTGGEEPAFIFARGLNYGAGLTWLPFSSTILVNLNVDGNLIPHEANYVSVQFGLSYLF